MKGSTGLRRFGAVVAVISVLLTIAAVAKSVSAGVVWACAAGVLAGTAATILGAVWELRGHGQTVTTVDPLRMTAAQPSVQSSSGSGHSEPASPAERSHEPTADVAGWSHQDEGTSAHFSSAAPAERDRPRILPAGD